MIIEIGLATAIGLGIASIPPVLGIIKLVSMVLDNKSPKDSATDNSVQTLSDNLEKANDDIKELSKDITEIHLRMAEAKTDVEIKNLQNQMQDLKVSLTRLQDKVERVAELTINILSKD